MSVAVSLWISVYCSGGGRNDAELNPCDFFFWCTGLLVCLSAFLAFPTHLHPASSLVLLPPGLIWRSYLWICGNIGWVRNEPQWNLPLAIFSVRAGCLPGYRPVSARLAEGASCWLWWKLQKVPVSIWSPSYKTHRDVPFPFILCLEKLL